MKSTRLFKRRVFVMYVCMYLFNYFSALPSSFWVRNTHPGMLWEERKEWGQSLCSGKGSNETNRPVRWGQWCLIHLRQEFDLPRSSYYNSSIYMKMNSFKRTAFCLSVFAYKVSYSMAQIMSECWASETLLLFKEFLRTFKEQRRSYSLFS